MDSNKKYTEKPESLGSNSIYEASPSVLTFAGYEVKKTQSLKLVVRNISSQSQRLSILPTTTPFFKPHYNKKGQLAPGISEVIVVQFTPSDWRYYYDCLRLLTPAGNINIPIHAYPVMNSNERYIPSLIDLGKCSIGTQITKQISLECTVPVAFEYEIKVIDPHPDISIGPVTGEVPPKGVLCVDITYTPHSSSTASCEMQFSLSEFDYKPIKTRIIASATHPSPLKPENTSKNLLTGSKDNFQNRKKLPDLSKFTKTVTKAAQALVAPKTIDRVIYEQQFNTEYRKLEEYDREKEFKIYVSLGNPHPSEEFIASVYKEREEKDNNRLLNIRKKDIGRNSHDIDADKSIIPVEFVPENGPSWNAYQNDEFSLRQLPLQKFVKAASTIIARLRADKRISQIKSTLDKNNVKTRAQAREFVMQDWKHADLIGIGVQDFIPFSFQISDESISYKLFPEEFSDNLDEFKKTLEINSLTTFDTYYPMKYIEPQDFLLAGYPDMLNFPASNYLPIEKEREYRQGAEEEYSVSLERGEFRDDPIFQVPNNAEKPIAIDPLTTVRPNPNLRCYLTLSAITQTSPEYLLTPKEIPRAAYEENPGYFYPTSYMLCNKWRPKGVYTAIKLPEKLKGVHPAEVLSESDSDNENTVNIEVPNLENYLAMFEADDENIKLAPRNNAKVDALAALCEEIEKNKQKNIAWLPSQITLANKQISEPEYKLSIL
jgi:hypothetical protein